MKASDLSASGGLVQNSGTTSGIRFPNPLTEKPPGCLRFTAIQKKMLCFAMAKR
jgi:hypothetical protein